MRVLDVVATTAKRVSLAALLLIVPVVASAATTYRYIGPDYTMFSGTFVAGEHVAGLFTTASPLAANLANVDVTAQVLSYRFSDGVNEYRSTDPNSRVRLFNVTTDAGGAIVGWHLIFDEWESGTTPHAAGDLASSVGTYNVNGDAAVDTGTCLLVGTATNGVEDVCLNVGGGTPLGVASVSGPPGTWELSVAAPAPALSPGATMALLALLAAIAGIALRRRTGIDGSV